MLVAAAVLGLWAGPASAAAPASPGPGAAAAGECAGCAAALDPAGLLLFSVAIDNLTLTEGLGAYGDPEDPLLPVGELARLLEADVDVLPAEQRIVGRLGEARRGLMVDLATRTARIGPREAPLKGGDFAVSATEIYLRASVVEKLFGAGVEVAPDELAIRLAPSERFPVQARLQRLARRPDGSGVTTTDEEALLVSQPYAPFSPPAFDVLLDGGLESRGRGRTGRYDIRMAGDLFYSNVQGYLGSDEEGRAANARILLQRRSLEGNLLGPARAREVGLGDTFAPGLAIGPRSVGGRGVSFSTVPFDRSNIFNRIDLRGELPPGYDVELYVNEVLRGGTNEAVNGRYEFLDVPLSPGVNILRVVTYGPRGERNEEVQVVNVGAGLLQPGEATFVFGAVEQDTPLIRLRESARPISQPGFFGTGGWRVVGGLNYGLTSFLTLSAGAARVPLSDDRSAGIFTLGARTSLAGLATQFDAAWDDEGGTAASLGLAGAMRGVSAVLRHAEYRDGFIDENNLAAAVDRELQRRTELNLDANLDLRGRIFPVSIRAIRNDYVAGAYDVVAGARASSSLAGVLLSTGLEYQRQAYRPAAAVETLSGYVTASTFRSFRWQVRATLDYQLLPDLRARFLSVTVDRQMSDSWSLRFGLGQPLDDFGDWNLVLASIYRTRYGDVSISGEYDNRDSDWRLGAQWSFGLGYNPQRGGYELTPAGPASGGSVLFNAFLDENGDGVRQPNEPPAPDVALEGVGRSATVTGSDGRVYVTGIGAGPTARLDVNLEQVDALSVRTPPRKIDLRPRPGAVARVDYPLRPTGEVMVRIELLRDDGRRVGLSSVRVQMVPEAGGAPVEAVTEFDGSALFEALPLGAYRLRLDPAQAAKLRMRLLEDAHVTIKGGGAFNPDLVAQVRFDPPTQTAATGP
jgi:hypothetical protein